MAQVYVALHHSVDCSDLLGEGAESESVECGDCESATWQRLISSCMYTRGVHLPVGRNRTARAICMPLLHNPYSLKEGRHRGGSPRHTSEQAGPQMKWIGAETVAAGWRHITTCLEALDVQ